jgi:hypothetical protein
LFVCFSTAFLNIPEDGILQTAISFVDLARSKERDLTALHYGLSRAKTRNEAKYLSSSVQRAACSVQFAFHAQ